LVSDHVEPRSPSGLAVGTDARDADVLPVAGIEEDDLVREGVYLSRQVFGVAPSSRLVERYASASRSLLRDPTQARLAAALHQAVREEWDVEALELALRLRNRSNLVTQKVHLLSYLIETQVAGSAAYLNDRSTPVRAYLVLAAHAVRALWKLAWGTVLMKRLRIHV
jgi:hypothetical protein